MNSQEANERLAAAVTPYGVGTRSYNRSSEAREVKRQAKEATEKYLAQPHVPIILPVMCDCRSYRFPHPISRHKTLKHPGDWTPWQERYFFDKATNCWTEKPRDGRTGE